MGAKKSWTTVGSQAVVIPAAPALRNVYRSHRLALVRSPGLLAGVSRRFKASVPRGWPMKRSGHGQSMVEYALAIGCVAALCMVAIGSLGHLSGHIFHTVEGAI